MKAYGHTHHAYIDYVPLPPLTFKFFRCLTIFFLNNQQSENKKQNKKFITKVSREMKKEILIKEIQKQDFDISDNDFSQGLHTKH